MTVAAATPPRAPKVEEQPVQLAEPPAVAPAPAPKPAPAHVEVPRPAPVVPKPITVPEKKEAGPLDTDTLPRLHPSDFGKYGLDGISLNMLREPSKDRPNGLAIINLNKVYPGEVIQGSKARLLAVARTGIAIEIEGSGDQYFIEQ